MTIELQPLPYGAASITLPCDCEMARAYWSAFCSSGICAECLVVYVCARSFTGRRGVNTYALGAFMEACRQAESWPAGGGEA